MAKGGARPGAGKKKGHKTAVTIAKEKAREYIIDRVTKELDPILTAQIDLALDGDIAAAQYLMNQAYGRPKETVDMNANIKEAVHFYLPNKDDMETSIEATGGAEENGV